jgi:hypothetical protein
VDIEVANAVPVITSMYAFNPRCYPEVVRPVPSLDQHTIEVEAILEPLDTNVPLLPPVE